MATTTTFTTLQADVRRYLERGDSYGTDPVVFEQIPRAINLAERNIATELKVQGEINVVTTTMNPGQSVYAKPDRWRDTISINVGTGPAPYNTRKSLFTRSYEYSRAYWPDESQTGEPNYYADYNRQNWLITPTPDAPYPFEVLYYQLPVLLDDENQTNWLTEFAPQLLLYRTLLELTPFLKNDKRIPVWQSMYDRAAAMVNGEDLAKILDRSTVRKEA
jgi:hypothetical protein